MGYNNYFSEYPIDHRYINSIKDSEIILQKLNTLESFAKEQGFELEFNHFQLGENNILINLGAVYNYPVISQDTSIQQ